MTTQFNPKAALLRKSWLPANNQINSIDVFVVDETSSPVVKGGQSRPLPSSGDTPISALYPPEILKEEPKSAAGAQTDGVAAGTDSKSSVANSGGGKGNRFYHLWVDGVYILRSDKRPIKFFACAKSFVITISPFVSFRSRSSFASDAQLYLLCRIQCNSLFKRSMQN